MEWLETTGRSLEEAEEAALRELGVARDDAEFQILSQPKAGLFGRMRSEARVRARVRPAFPRPKEDRSERRRRNGRPSRAAAHEQGGVTTVATDGRTDGGETAEAVALSVQAEVAQTFLEGLLEQFRLEGTVRAAELDDETVELAIQGDDLALLIGPRGAAATAVQDLARTVVQRRTGARQGRVLVDVAGYRRKRKEALERFTRKVAADVVSSGQEQVLEPMNPADRKVVHDTVNGVDGATTRSEGEEPRRRVVIAPEPAS